MRIFGIVTALLMFSLVLSCSVFAPIKVANTNSYQISLSHESEISCESAANLPDIQVMRMKADEPYDSNEMLYSKVKFQLGSYAKNQWVAPPSIMLTKAIQEKLLQSCAFSNVVSADFMTMAKYRLNSQLLELRQNVRDSDASVSLVILVQLINNETNQVVKSKTFIEKADGFANANGYVLGTNTTVANFLNHLVMWLKTTTK